MLEGQSQGFVVAEGRRRRFGRRGRRRGARGQDALEHHHVRFAGGAEPHDVAIAERGGRAHPAVVDVQALFAARVCDGEAGGTHLQAGVVRAHPRECELEAAGGIGAEKHLGADVLEHEPRARERPSKDGERCLLLGHKPYPGSILQDRMRLISSRKF